MADAEDDLGELLQRAFRYALSLTHHRSLAEDLVQDACLGVAKNGGPWRIGYVLTAVRNRYIDHCRRDGVLKLHPLGDIDLAGAADIELSTDAATDGDLGGAFDGDLAAALARLKPAEREMVYLAVVEEYTTGEIATLIGRPRGTVLSGIHRAKEKLRRWMTRGEAPNSERINIAATRKLSS